jgi:hypothetical protein
LCSLYAFENLSAIDSGVIVRNEKSRGFAEIVLFFISFSGVKKDTHRR